VNNYLHTVATVGFFIHLETVVCQYFWEAGRVPPDLTLKKHFKNP